MKNLVINAFATKSGYKTSPQIRNNNSYETYLMNSFVSLYSTKLNNTNLTCCFITNMDLPDKWKLLFEKNEILIIKIPFDEFILPEDFTWALAFFKLHALKFACENLNYDKFLMIDTDTYVSGNLDCLFDEIENNKDIMLYNIGHSLDNKDRQVIINNYRKIYGFNKNIVHYGGELVAGTKEGLQMFTNDCIEIFNQAKVLDKLDRTTGDEYIISVAAYDFEGRVLSSEPYIHRYWTGAKSFHLVSTNWKYNGRVIWHVPTEKESGMVMLFKHLAKSGKNLTLEKTAKLLGLPFCHKEIFFNNVKRRALRRWYNLSLLNDYKKNS